MYYRNDFSARIVLFVVVCMLSFGLPDVCAKTWTQFRGPGGLGVAEASTLPANWSDRENIIWKATIPGAGASSPVIYGNRMFLTFFTGFGVDSRNPGNIDDLKRHVLCLDRESGGILWQKEVTTLLPESNTRRFLGYASSTPAVDADRVFSATGLPGI